MSAIIEKIKEYQKDIDIVKVALASGDPAVLAAALGKRPWPEPIPDFAIKDTVVQRAIAEKEVVTYLEKGFTFKAQLQNGTVIVETTIPAADIAVLTAENMANMAKKQIDAAITQLTNEVFAGNIAGSSQDPIIPRPVTKI
jgi:hypothetical protein